MRVTTINGGFRGRGFGALTSAQTNEAVEQLDQALAEFFSAIARLQQAASLRAIPEADASRLIAAMDLLNERYTRAVTDELTAVQNSAQLAEWRSRIEIELVRPALAWVDDVLITTGDEAAARPWKIGVAIIGGLLAVGAGVWVVSRLRKR